MEMKSVKSSSISKIGYKRRTMKVEFVGGKTYEFKRVPRAVYDNFIDRNHQFGSFFVKEIKNKYPTTSC